MSPTESSGTTRPPLRGEPTGRRRIEEALGGTLQPTTQNAVAELLGKAGHGAQKALLRDGSVRPVSGPMSGWTGSRDLPPLAKKSFRELWKEGL